MTQVRCPKCGGDSLRPIAPGYWECVSLVQPESWRCYQGVEEEHGTDTPPAVTCLHRFAVTVPPGEQPACDCGTFAIGRCVECGRPVCGDHSSVFGGRRLCETHGEAEMQRIVEVTDSVWREKIARLAALHPDFAAKLDLLGAQHGKAAVMQTLDWELQQAEEAHNASSQPVLSPPPAAAPRPGQPTYTSAEEALRARVAADRTALEQEDRQRRAEDRASVAAELPAFRTLLADTLDRLARADYPGGELLYFDTGRWRRRRPRAAWLLFTRQGRWARDGYLTDRYYLLASGEIWGFVSGRTVKIELAELTPADLAEARTSLLRIQSLTD